MKSISLLILSTLLAFPAFAARKADEAKHYRAVHANAPISISVSDDLDRSSYAYRVFASQRGFDPANGVDPADEAIRALPGSLRDYLVENGIAVADSSASRHLRVSVNKINHGIIAQGTQRTPTLWLGGEVTYSPVSGEPTTLKLRDWGGQNDDPEAAARTLARAAIDKALLIWQPAKKAARIKPPTGKSDSNALFTTSPTGAKHPAPHDAPVVLSWEAFPSDRILTGSTIKPADISDVSYELRFRPYRGGAKRVQAGMADRNLKSQVVTLMSPRFDLGSQLPWCGEITWSARARFNLNGHPRVTHWSQSRASGPQGLGFVTRVGAPEGFECFRGGKIKAAKPIGAAAAWSSQEPVQLKPLAAGEGVASIVLTGSRCGIDENRCSADVYRDNNRALHRQLQKVIDKLGNGINVQDGGDLVDPTWFGDGRGAFQINLAELYEWLANDDNRASLKASGIRRVLAIHSGDKEQLVSSSSTSDFGGMVGVGETQTRTISSLVIFADIIDVETGEQLAQLEVAAQGSETKGAVWLLIIPVPYKFDKDAFEEGVELIASVGAHALIGARIGWPAEFRKETD